MLIRYLSALEKNVVAPDVAMVYALQSSNVDGLGKGSGGNTTLTGTGAQIFIQIF